MKINFNKIIFTIFLIMIFSTNINAGVLNCADGKSIILKETSQADPAGMTAIMPICATTKHAVDEKGNKKYKKILDGPDFEKVDKKDPHAVIEYGDTLTKAHQRSIDNKTTIPIEVHICNDDNAVVNGTMQCNYVTTTEVKKDYCIEYKEVKEEYVDFKCDQLCKKNPHMVTPDDDDPCGCKRVRTYQVCAKTIENYCEVGTYGYWGDYGWTCGENHAWTYEKDFGLPFDTPGVTQSTAEGACKTANKHKCTCNPDTLEYILKCPIYECVKGDIKVNMCTPSFQEEESGNDVYCVNPSQPFAPGRETTAEYIKDESFNVIDCESSYSTVDCGYANILIEGEYHNLDKKTIELALRLWGVHTNQSGFNKIGVSNRRIPNNKTTCSKSVFYMRDGDGRTGSIVNPYKRSYEEFKKVLLNKVRDRDYIDPTSDFNLFESTCVIENEKLGIVCGDSIMYKQAFALLASTILGNDRMQEHLSELFNGEISEEVKTVNLINDKDDNQFIEVHFTEIKEITSASNVEINCKKLDEMVSENIITEEQKAKIEKYCQVEVSIVDGNGNVLGKYGSGVPEYCYKDFCRIRIKKFAICDVEKEVTTPIKVRVTYNKSNSSKSINKYVSCSNPADNQIMMGFDDKLLINTNLNDPHTTTTVEKISEEFVITNYKCAGKCDDYSLRGKFKDKCSDDTENYYKTYNSSIKDPSLNCIVNMGSPTYKNLYDYSEYYGVNPNLCRIYCSDQVEYYIADKVKTISGTLFYYDIEQSVRNEKDPKYLFSNIVKEKRTCVSEIFYEKEFSESINWKKLYNLGSDKNYDGSPDDNISQSEIDGIKNWKTLFSVMVKKALDENGRTENLNKLLYDLYNCNLYSESEIEANGIKKPQNDDIGNIKENLEKIFSEENSYGLGPDSGCTITDTSNNCISMKNITYEFGAKPDGNSSEMKSVTENINTLDELVYCSGEDCFTYTEESKEHEYEYPTSGDSETEKIEIQINRGKELELKFNGRTTIKVPTKKGDKINFNGRTTIEVPTNDYVMFEASTEVSFYNGSQYEVKPSGEVIYAGTDRSEEKYMALKAFSYPVYKDAYNVPICTNRDFLSDSKRCEITQQYENVNTYYRRNINDDFSNKVRLSNKFTCYVDVKKPTTISCDDGNVTNSTLYRNVDTSNMFPSSSDGFTTNPKSNWGTDFGKKATIDIKNSSDDLIVTDDYLEYRITLSPTQINHIKEYNKENDNYINEYSTKCKIVDNTYQECISPFMDELRRSNLYGSIDPNFNFGKSIKKSQKNENEKIYYK